MKTGQVWSKFYKECESHSSRQSGTAAVEEERYTKGRLCTAEEEEEKKDCQMEEVVVKE